MTHIEAMTERRGARIEVKLQRGTAPTLRGSRHHERIRGSLHEPLA